jgi:hypothetical protein
MTSQTRTPPATSTTPLNLTNLLKFSPWSIQTFASNCWRTVTIEPDKVNPNEDFVKELELIH